MPGSGDNGTVRTLVTACSVRSGDVYRRYVSRVTVAGRVASPGPLSLPPCPARVGEWDAYAGVGLVGQYGAA